jgi:hypothetical protein
MRTCLFTLTIALHLRVDYEHLGINTYYSVKYELTMRTWLFTRAIALNTRVE